MDSKEREIKDLREQIKHLTDRMEQIGQDSVEEAEGRGHEYLSQAADALREKGRFAKGKAKEAGKRAHEYAQENPWQIAGAAALAGIALGVAMMSRRNRD